MTSPIRLPSVFADYECRRSLLCCRPPWRVWLSEADVDVVRHTTGANAEAPGTPVEFEDAVEDLGAGGRLMAQTGDRCVLLEEQEPACRLQSARGLLALPLQCRNFPRSVVRTPAGVEVAFLLDCPTAAGLAVSAPQPFRWLSVARPDWPYPPVFELPEALYWSVDRTMGLSELEGLREGWWSLLDSTEARTGRGLTFLCVLTGLIEAPDDPRVDEQLDLGQLGEPLGGQEAAMALFFLERQPEHGPRYRAEREALLQALQVRRDPDVLASVAEARMAEIACATGLILQHAGVHDGRPASQGLRATGQQLAFALSLCLALERVEGVSQRTGLRDALTASSQYFRLRRFSQGVFVD